jgi:hypothetical protein
MVTFNQMKIPIKHKLRWILIVAGILLSIYLVITRPLLWYRPDRPPVGLVTSNIIDLDRVFDISKFRSGAGHDYSYNAGESCRSMKHYFGHAHTYGADHKPTRTQGTATDPVINIYAPFDGIVINKGGGGPPGHDIQIMSLRHSQFYMRFFHVDALPSLHFGSYVKSGQPVATIGPKDGMDVSIEANSILAPHGVLVSVFQVMTDHAFAPYKALGYQRDDFIISRQYRDAHPLQCQPQGQFTQMTDARDNLIFVRPDIYEATTSRGPGFEIHYGPPVR